MKRLILGSLSFFLLASMIVPALAFDNPYVKGKTAPFNLIGLAYQRFFEEQGIPSAEGLLSAYRMRKISGKDVVRSAIQANRLSADVLNDPDYLAAVESQLEALSRGNK